MSHQYFASSARARSILAVIAFAITTLVLGTIDGLSNHYGAQGQLATAKPLSVAQR